VLVTWFIVDRVGLSLASLRTLDPARWVPSAFPLGAASLALLIGYGVSAALWGRIVADLGGPRLRAPDAVRVFMVANLGRYVPGKVWQIAGLAALARGRGVPAATATAAAVLGQGIALVAATLVGAGALARTPGRAGPWAVGFLAAMIVAVAVGLAPPVFRAAVGLWFRLAHARPPEALSSRAAVRWLAAYVLNWMLYATSFWLLVRSFGLDAPLVPVAGAFAAAYVLGYIMVFAPAGLGVREGFMVALLTPYLGVGPSGAMAVIARLWTTVLEVVPAAAFWMRHMILRNRRGSG